MAERVRIEHFEAEDVKRILSEYKETTRSTLYTNSHYHPQVEDLVNRIGEIYEKALARKGSVRP